MILTLINRLKECWISNRIGVMELKRYKLGEILELQRGYDLPSSQQKAGNVLVAGSNGIIGYHNEIRGNHPCITVGRSGSVGKVHYYEQPTWAHNTALFVKDFKGNNPQYLYYFLKNLHLDEMFVKGSSVVPSLDRKVVHSLVVPFHKEVVCQKRIALVLSNIDRKIELNRAINQNLEAMAKQLYDYWFVQFDFPNEEGKPYKSSGGEMVWNKELKREIPKEWTVAKLTDEMELQYGFPFSTDLFTEQITSVPVVRIRDILDNSISAYTTEDVEGRYLLQKQDLLIGMDGNFHINYWADNVSYLNQRTVRIRAKNNSNVSIVQAKYDIQPYIKAKEARAKGSTVGHLSDKDMKELYVLVCPNKKAREKFDALLSMIITNRNEVETLTKQRDELLPLLMNGQVSVNSDLSVYKKKRRGRIPSLTLNQVSDIQILHRQSIVLLTKQVLMDELQSERLIILVIIPFGTEIFVPIAWHVLLEETSQVFQAFGLVLLEVAAHDDDAPVGEVASSVAVLPEADVAVQITLTDVHAKAVGILHHATTVSVAELLTQVEIEIKNQIFLFHN